MNLNGPQLTFLAHTPHMLAKMRPASARLPKFAQNPQHSCLDATAVLKGFSRGIAQV